jgi:heme-degrading monooxygenase HmoA
MFVAVVELSVDEKYREQLESTFPESMRATLPGVPGLTRASFLAPAESGHGYLAILEFASERAYRAYLDSDAFRAAHPWSGRVPLISNALTTYTMHTDLTSADLAGLATST